MAGKRKGKEDERHLWPEMLRAIREIQPRWVVGENVFGLINWNGGMVFDEVQADLEAAGYEVWPYVLPACAVNAPHRRDRIWFVARRKNVDDSNDSGFQTQRAEQQTAGIEQYGELGKSVTTNTSEQRCDNGSDNRQERHIQTTGERQLQENKSEWNGRQFGISKDGSVSAGINTNSHSNGQHRSNSEHEIEPSKRGEYALNDVEPICDVADTAKSGRKERKQSKGRQNSEEIGAGLDVRDKRFSDNGDVADPYSNGGRKNNRQRKSGLTNKKSKINDWSNFPTQSPVCIGNDGISTRLDGITFSKWRNESIKAGGNAIVPNVVYQIFKAIEAYEAL